MTYADVCCHLLQVYTEMQRLLPRTPFRNDKEAIGIRRLANTCLGYLAELEDEEVVALIEKQVCQCVCVCTGKASKAGTRRWWRSERSRCVSVCTFFLFLLYWYRGTHTDT